MPNPEPADSAIGPDLSRRLIEELRSGRARPALIIDALVPLAQGGDEPAAVFLARAADGLEPELDAADVLAARRHSPAIITRRPGAAAVVLAAAIVLIAAILASSRRPAVSDRDVVVACALLRAYSDDLLAAEGDPAPTAAEATLRRYSATFLALAAWSPHLDGPARADALGALAETATEIARRRPALREKLAFATFDAVPALAAFIDGEEAGVGAALEVLHGITTDETGPRFWLRWHEVEGARRHESAGRG